MKVTLWIVIPAVILFLFAMISCDSADEEADRDSDDDSEEGPAQAKFCNSLIMDNEDTQMTLNVGGTAFADIWTSECSACKSIESGSDVKIVLYWKGAMIGSGIVDIDTREGDEWVFIAAEDEDDEVTVVYGSLDCNTEPWDLK